MKENCVISLGDINVRYLSADHQSEFSQVDFCHERFEILFHNVANHSLTVEGKQYKMKSGSLILINPFAYHRLEFDSFSEFEAWSLLFSKSSLSQSVADMLDSIIGEADNSGKFYDSKVVSSVKSIFERFYVASNLPD